MSSPSQRRAIAAADPSIRWQSHHERGDLCTLFEILADPGKVESDGESTAARIFAIMAADVYRDRQPESAGKATLRELVRRMCAVLDQSLALEHGILSYFQRLRLRRGTGFFEKFAGAELQGTPVGELRQDVLRLRVVLSASSKGA